MDRIPASERTREKLKALMEGRSEVADGRSELVRLAAVDHRGSAGRRSEGRVGAPLLRTRRRPRRRIATGIAPVG
jgi:hypothetical protein